MRASLVAVLLLALVAQRAGARPDRDADRAEDDVLLEFGALRELPGLSNPEDGEAYAIIGWVQLNRPEFAVRAAQMVIWLDPDATGKLLDLLDTKERKRGQLPVWAVRAIYAEGAQLPATFRVVGNVFRCSSLFYDFRTHKGTLLDPEVRMRLPGIGAGSRGLPLLLRAKKIRALEPGTFVGRDVFVTVTEGVDAEVDVRVKRVRFDDPNLRAAFAEITRLTARRQGLSGPTEEEIDEALKRFMQHAREPVGKRLRLNDITPRIYDIPVLYWPQLTLQRGDSQLPIRIAPFASFGGRLRTGFGLTVGQPPRRGPLMAGWEVTGAYHDKRGPLVRSLVNLQSADGLYSGTSFGVYMDDHGTDRNSMEPPTQNRFWTKNQHRWHPFPTWRVDLEVALLSDPEWLRLYDEREFKEGKEQETLVYVRKRDDRGYVTFTGKIQSISFIDTVEELPRLVVVLPVLRLFQLGAATVRLESTYEVADLKRHRPAGALPKDSFGGARLHTVHRLTATWSAGIFRVTPFTALQGTLYERTAGDDRWVGRVAGSVGLRIDTQASRWFGGGEIRHLVNISLELEDLFHVSRRVADLLPVDAVDRITTFEVVGLRIRNRIQRRVGPWMRDFLDVEIFLAWFPNQRQPEGIRGDGFLEFDVEWIPWRNWDLQGRAQFDLKNGDLLTASILVIWQVSPGLRIGNELRVLRGDSNVWTGTVELDVGRRWRVAAFTQFDFKNDDALDQGLRIDRLGRNLVVSLRISGDPGDNDFSFGFEVNLTPLFDPPRRVRAVRDTVGWR